MVPRWVYEAVKVSGLWELPESNGGHSCHFIWSKKHVVEYNHFVNFSLMFTILDSRVQPSSIEEALASKPWVIAMTELNNIKGNCTWVLVPHPPRHKVIGVRWVYKTQYHPDGSLDKHKDRLVLPESWC